MGLIAPFPFYSTFDVATTIVELQQLHINSSVIKGIVTCNLFLLKFVMNLKNKLQVTIPLMTERVYVQLLQYHNGCGYIKSWVERESGYEAQREYPEIKWAQKAKEPKST